MTGEDGPPTAGEGLERRLRKDVRSGTNPQGTGPPPPSRAAAQWREPRAPGRRPPLCAERGAFCPLWASGRGVGDSGGDLPGAEPECGKHWGSARAAETVTRAPCRQVVPVLVHLLSAISSVRLYIPRDLRPLDNRQSVLKSIQVGAPAAGPGSAHGGARPGGWRPGRLRPPPAGPAFQQRGRRPRSPHPRSSPGGHRSSSRRTQGLTLRTRGRHDCGISGRRPRRSAIFA